MTIDADALNEQMEAARYRDGRWERFEGGQWVPWPVLTLDRLARKSINRARTQRPTE